MRRLLVAISLLLIAATPNEVVAELKSDGYYIEPGAAASEQIVSDAVFEARADGGRLYLVVLFEEPSGGATTFADAVLDRLGTGYVVVVAPQTVGFAGDGSFWSADEMNRAIDASLSGGTDDEVIRLFVSELTAERGSPTGEATADRGGIPGWVWLGLLVGAGVVMLGLLRSSSQRRDALARTRLDTIKAKAREKLAEIANDIVEMEDEVNLSENPEVKAHYQRASSTYVAALSAVEEATEHRGITELIRNLDLAIWELDAAEAILDGKPAPAMPKEPEPTPVMSKVPDSDHPDDTTSDTDYHRRPQRQSSYAGENLMTALWALLATTSRGRGGWGGMSGGFGGPIRGGSRGRIRGGQMRGGGIGRIRGGGRRR